MSTTTITQTRPSETKTKMAPEKPSVIGRIRERRRAAEEQKSQGNDPKPSVGFMAKSSCASNMPIYPGLDRWRLLQKIGDGAFSSVYRASDTKSEIGEAAIKVTKKYEMHEKQKEKLSKEVDITRKLDHDNVVRLIDSFESRQFHYMILELCPGGELYDQIIKFTSLSEDMSRHVIKQVAHAVEYLHETLGVVHRDIKPENILIYPPPSTHSQLSTPRTDYDDIEEAVSIPKAGSGDIGVVKLADFGLSKVICGIPTATPCGTAGYAAPELFNELKYTTSVDMWALGCLLFTMLAGCPPFYDEDIKVMTRKVMRGDYTFSTPIWSRISNDAKDLVSCLLTVKPENRLTIKECLAHPWIRDSSEEATPAGDAPFVQNEPNNSETSRSSGNSPIEAPVQAFTDNENMHAYPETPNIRDAINVALSVRNNEHEWHGQRESTHKRASSTEFAGKEVLPGLDIKGSKLLEKRKILSQGGPHNSNGCQP